MSTPRLFSPRDIRNDMGRFGGSLFYFMDAAGKPQSGLLGLVGIQHRKWDEDARIVSHEPTWTSSLLTLVYRNLSNGGNMVETKGTGLKGLTLNFTPTWTHKGYTMYNRAEDSRPRITWLSMASNRQYRWGLSTRAFEMRSCRSWPSTLNAEGPPSWLLAAIWQDGPQYVAPRDIDLRVGGQALTPQLAVHCISNTAGALVHNARTVVGFYHNNALLVEHQAKRLTTSIKDHVDYVPTATLTRLYTTDILPGSMQPRQQSEPESMELSDTARELRSYSRRLELMRSSGPAAPPSDPSSWFTRGTAPDFWAVPPDDPSDTSS